MRRLQVTLDGQTLLEAPLPAGRTVIGRRPDAPVHIDDLSVSGHHAAITIADNGQAVLEDLASTNGTMFNGVPIRRRTLESGDVFTIGRYRLHYQVEPQAPEAPTTDDTPPDFEATRFGAPTVLDEAQEERPASLMVLSGPATGRALRITKPTTTLGKAEVSVAVIERHGGFYMLVHRQGAAPTVNGATITQHAIVLNHGDLIEIAGSQVLFMCEPA